MDEKQRRFSPLDQADLQGIFYPWRSYYNRQIQLRFSPYWTTSKVFFILGGLNSTPPLNLNAP